MDIIRLHTGPEGDSAAETVSLPMSQEDEQGHRSATFQTTKAVFCEAESGFVQGWHNPPYRKLVIVLSGTMEIELRDGTLIHIEPGQILLAEDLSGSGHVTRTKGDQPLQTVVIAPT